VHKEEQIHLLVQNPTASGIVASVPKKIRKLETFIPRPETFIPVLTSTGDVYPLFILIYPHLSPIGDIYTCFNLDSPIYHNKLLSGNGKSVRVRPNLFIYKQLYAKSINRTIILDMPKSGSLWLLYGHIKQFGKVV